MALSRAEFLVKHPEFARTATALVDAKLAEAERRVSRAVYGATADDAVAALAAHLIASAPTGLPMRVDDKKGGGATIYLREFRRIRRALGAGITVGS